MDLELTGILMAFQATGADEIITDYRGKREKVKGQSPGILDIES